MSSSGRRFQRGHFPGGRLTLSHVKLGKNLLTVIPDDPALESRELIEIEIEDAPNQAVRVELQRRVALPVDVLLSDTRPIAGSRIEWLTTKHGDDRVHVGAWAVPIEQLHVTDSTAYLVILQATATTNETGRAELLVPPGSRGWVRANGPGHAAVLHGPLTVAAAQNDPVRLVVQLGARVRGRLEPAEYMKTLVPPASPWKASVILRSADGDVVEFSPSGRPRSTTLEADGTFEIQDVPARRWDLFLQGVRAGALGGWTSQSAVAPVATLDLREGETTEVVIDATRLMPATLTGTIRIDGKPHTGVYLEAARCGESRHRSFRMNTDVSADDRGAFSAQLQPPACYRIGATFDNPSSHGTFLLLDWFQAVAGTSVHHDFDLRTGTVRFRLLEADGNTLLPNRTVYFWSADGELRATGTTNDDGWVDLPPMPAARLEPRVHRSTLEKARQDGLSWQDLEANAWRLDPFTITAGTTTEVVRKLPAK
jgi:hypothetical protein